jgi:predicted AlkP superfamily phosphohydrolase/phosphomutase
MGLKKHKVLVLGLDGATFDLLKPWSDRGELPTIRRLMMEGSWGSLYSTIPPMTAPAWTSFMTGKNPGKHGLYDWVQRVDESYEFFPITANHIQEPTLWSLLSARERRVCVVNVPMTYPPTTVNGVMIAGMPAPSTHVSVTYPPDLLPVIEKEVGEYLLYPDPGQAYSDSGVDAFLDRLYSTTEARFQVLEYLRGLDDWDFCMVVLNGTDTVQHAMWKFMSPEHPLHDPKKFEKYGDTILRYFQYVDKALSRIVFDLDDDTVLVLMSDHGFGPFHKFIHVNMWLRQQGWLKIRNDSTAKLKSTFFDLGFTPMRIYDLLMRFGLGALKREVVRGQGQGLLKRLFLSFDDVDWPRTTAYSLGNVGQIRLNVRGREPQGLIEPGEQYEVTRDEIIRRLWELRDPRTDEQVIQEVYRREEIYWGHNLELAADIVFIPTRLEYFGFGEYEFGSNKIIESMKRGISGTHRLNGMLLMWGKPIRADTQIEGAQIIDLAPTILYLIGEAVLTDMDGQVLTQAFKPEYASSQKVEVRVPAEPGSSPPTTTDNGISDEDAKLISERLRGLGYVG